jgi:hypothetical protein
MSWGLPYVQFTNQKGQMPPRRQFTLTREIPIRGQPIKNYKPNFFGKILKFKKKKKKKFIMQLFSADAKLFSKKKNLDHENMKNSSSKVAHNSYLDFFGQLF